MVFLFIAVSYMLIAVREQERIKKIAVTYNDVKDKLYAALENEFRDGGCQLSCHLKTFSCHVQQNRFILGGFDRIQADNFDGLPIPYFL